MPTKPAVTKKAPRAAAKPAPKTKRASAAQTTLDDLLKASNAHAALTEKVIHMLLDDRKARAVAALEIPGSSAQSPIVVDGANARLSAMLDIFSGKSAQQILQDMLETGRPPSRETLLRLADKQVTATSRG
ncbi:hypothetical protein [Herbaspirillum autotrophicum]|uniref:hypothetical protein n=1 Tax=Herbaspirillum autotrophicum TaxID=180195 RepID=UPI00067CF433|nr:hypothetical protein [Herbaspirillum autotrophicum]